MCLSQVPPPGDGPHALADDLEAAPVRLLSRHDGQRSAQLVGRSDGPLHRSPPVTVLVAQIKFLRPIVIFLNSCRRRKASLRFCRADGQMFTQYGAFDWTIFDGAENKDAFCVDLLSDLGWNLGCGIVNLINAYDPKYIIIDGLYAQKKSQILMFAIKDIICKRTLPEIYQNLIIQYSEQPVFSVLRGAAAIATNGLLSDPCLILNS